MSAVFPRGTVNECYGPFRPIAAHNSRAHNSRAGFLYPGHAQSGGHNVFNTVIHHDVTRASCATVSF